MTYASATENLKARKDPQEEMKMRMKAKTFTTLDLYLSAFLSLSGIHPFLELKNSRVTFAFPATDDLYQLMTNFNDNVSVPVAEFVTAIKSLRGQMLTLRGRG